MIKQLHVDRRVYEIKRDFGLPFSYDSESKKVVERPFDENVDGSSVEKGSRRVVNGGFD